MHGRHINEAFILWCELLLFDRRFCPYKVKRVLFSYIVKIQGGYFILLRNS